MKKGETKICKICNGFIALDTDDYCYLEDFFKGEYIGDGWFHIKCFNDKIKGEYSKNMLKKAMEMVGLKPREQKIEVSNG